MKNSLKQSITTVLSFFDIFDYPLTKEEIYNFLYKPDKNYTLKQVSIYLSQNNFNNKNNYYFLSQREDIINIRKKRKLQSIKKYKKIKKISWFFKFIPFIKMIAIGNFLPSKNTKEESDLDFFIITKKNRIWLTRLLTIFLSTFLGGRPTKENKKDKICLTFFITEENLNIKNIALHNNDIYLHYWIANLVPIYNKNQTYEKFINKNNWAKNYLPNIIKKYNIKQKNKEKKANKIINRIEKITKKIQLKKMPKYLKEKANKNTEIIINDRMLKFHNNDKRKYYYNKFQKKNCQLKADS